MKTLIVAINAKYIHSNLAAYSLRAYALKHLRDEMSADEIEIEIAEYTINQYTEQILADLYCRHPEVIAISCYIWNIRMVEQLVPELRKVLPEADLWLGGPEVSYDTAETIRRLPIKGIMIGEGERTFRWLLHSYIQTHKEKLPVEKQAELLESYLREIPGIACETFMTQASQYIDMNELEFPYGPEYVDATEFQNRIIYYESSRGCPFSCAYCLSSIDLTVRLRDTETVKRELGFFLQQRVRQVKFVDRTFNCNHRHAVELWKYILENDNGVTNFHFEISADLLTKEELELLASMRSGLVQLEIGVQSVHKATIEEINRKADFEKIKRVVERLKAGRNIHLHLDLIAGLPKENYDTFVTSFNQVYALKPEQLQLGFLKVLKGSPMAERTELYGIQALSYAPYEVLSTKWISYEEILRLKAVEQVLEMYYNSSQFENTLALLENAFADGFSLYRCLAEYYAEAGYDLLQPSRIKKYEILLEFAERYDKERLNFYYESLILDLYLRENLKNRPDFAMDQKPYKEQIQAFYRQEDIAERYLPEYQGCDSRQISKMTHIEVFRYIEEAEGEDGTCYMLFDYSRRDPLTQNAHTIRLLHL